MEQPKSTKKKPPVQYELAAFGLLQAVKTAYSLFN